MKLDPKKQMLDLTGKPILDGTPDRPGAPIEVGTVILSALLAGRDEPVEQKVLAYRVAQRVARATDAGESLELTVEEASLVKEKAGAIYGPIIVGQLYDIIENA